MVAPNGGCEPDITYTVTKDGVDITVQPNGKSSFPGVMITPAQPWDASGYGHMEVKVTNNGTKPFRANLRLDNEGPWQENRWSASVITIKPGQSTVVPAVFGCQYGKAGYALKPEAIMRAIVFIGKSDVEQKFRVEALLAAGPAGEKPYIDPNTVAVKPPGGVILGGSAPVDAAKQIVTKGGAKGALAPDGKAIQVDFAGGKTESVTFKPASGMWNLNEQLQVRVHVKNTGASSVTPSVQIESRGGLSDPIVAKEPVKPGAEAEIIVPFAAAVPWKIASNEKEEMTLELKKGFDANVPGTGSTYKSNITSGITILSDGSPGAKGLLVTSIVADMPPLNLPAWLGKKPPVDGDWVQTLDESFDGGAIDPKRWNIYTEKEWHLGANTHYSKNNVIVKDGKLALRVEKMRGHHNDNPDYLTNDYATGYADTFGKWTQRYGYFEIRVKLQTAPSMFPAFWLMPDRGINTPNGQWGKSAERTSTKDGGMEFDIMETLSIWGPYRHDFGMHWDGYMKYHKSNGMFNAYVQPDKDGFITVGMLWTPGVVVMYDNGKEAARWESPRVASTQEYILLTALTGGWESEMMDDAQLPADLVIDYIRVWQRKDLATPEDGPKPNEGGPLAPGITQEVPAAKQAK
jgi:beta-glucanase (GH16 family)